LVLYSYTFASFTSVIGWSQWLVVGP